MSGEEVIREAGGLDALLLSKKRLLIALFLYIHGPATLSEIRRGTGLTWSDIDHNTRLLAESGYVRLRRSIRGRPVVVAELTEEGVQRLEALLEALERLVEGLRGYRSPSPR